MNKLHTVQGKEKWLFPIILFKEGYTSRNPTIKSQICIPIGIYTTFASWSYRRQTANYHRFPYLCTCNYNPTKATKVHLLPLKQVLLTDVCHNMQIQRVGEANQPSLHCDYWNLACVKSYSYPSGSVSQVAGKDLGKLTLLFIQQLTQTVTACVCLCAYTAWLNSLII